MAETRPNRWTDRTAGTSTLREHDWSRINPSTAVIEPVADLGVCDPTALGALFRSNADGRRPSTEVQFTYDGLLLETSVGAEGSLVLHDIATDDAATIAFTGTNTASAFRPRLRSRRRPVDGRERRPLHH